MKPMGIAPPRSKENDKVLKEIYAERCNKANKPETPKEVHSDQFGAYTDFEQVNNRWSCCECGEPFALGQNFVHDGSYDTWWCESCFREMALTKYGVR